MLKTNRTLLVEEIAPDKENFVSMFYGMEERKSLSDEEIVEIHQNFEVSSFEEVIQKFNPHIYMSLDTDNLQVSFYKKVPIEKKDSIRAIPLCEDGSFLRVLFELMENKRKRKYVLTSFQELGDALLPTPNPETFFAKRDTMINELKVGNERKADEILSKMITQYDEGIFLLKAFLYETHIYLDEKASKEDDTCLVIDEENAQVRPLQISGRFAHNRYHTKEEEEKYLRFLDGHMKAKKVHNRNLMIWLLESGCKGRRKSLELIERYYRECLMFYEEILFSFWREAKPLFQTLLGIRNFFDASILKDDLPSKMVITNCTPGLLSNNRYRELFRLYLETVNEKTYVDNKIDNAIIPRIASKGKEKEKIRERFLSNKIENVYKANKPEDVQPVVEMLGKYQIQTFLSSLAGKNTTSYLTIFPQEYTCMLTGKKTRYDRLENKIYIQSDSCIWFDGLAVEVSYIKWK